MTSKGSTRRTLDRRNLIKGGTGAAVAAIAAPRITFAQDVATPSASPAASPVASPVVDASGYYPSGIPGVSDAYTKMPELYASTDGVPGNGGSVTAMIMVYGAPPPAKDSNQYWQGLDERLGVAWEPTLVPNSSYGEKATAILASGDVPDFFYLNLNQTASPLANFIQEGAFLDLTPYVTEEALQQYPNLAKFPRFMWDATATDGKIYGIPCPSGRTGQVPAFRTDWANKLGGMPTDAASFRDILVGMATNDPDGNGSADTWGLGRYSEDWDMSIFLPMFRVPNGWRVSDDGAFMRYIETEEFRMAVEFMAQLYADGAYHPDSSAMQFEQALQLFQSGRTGLHADGGPIYGKGGFLETIREYQPSAEVARLIPFGHDGGQGVTYNLPGIFGFTALPATLEGNDERIAELLRIMNWLSGPFGSEEWLYKSYGIEGTHFDYNENGFPIVNELYETENGGLTAYLGGNLGVNFNAEEPELGPILTEEAKAIYALGIDNPASSPSNLFSPAAIENGPVLSQMIADAITNVVTGREDISGIDNLVTQWRERGGDQIRAEYEAAYAANQG